MSELLTEIEKEIKRQMEAARERARAEIERAEREQQAWKEKCQVFSALLIEIGVSADDIEIPIKQNREPSVNFVLAGCKCSLGNVNNFLAKLFVQGKEAGTFRVIDDPVVKDTPPLTAENLKQQLIKQIAAAKLKGNA